MPHGNKKQLARKIVSFQTPFSHSTSKLEQKNSRQKTTRSFAPLPVSARPKSLLPFDFQNHEKCEQIFHQRLNCRNERLNNSRWEADGVY